MPTTGATASGNVLSHASAYVSSTFASASYMSQLVILLVMGLSGCLVVFLGLMWTAEVIGARRARRMVANARQQGYSTPTALPVSPFSSVPDLESPTKQQDDALLAEVSAYNKGVELIINESTDYSRPGGEPGEGGYRREARRQLNLKLKASPSLERVGGLNQLSGKFSPRDPTLSSMTIMRKRSNAGAHHSDAVPRKETLGANEHARIVQPLNMADLTVVESVRNRDITRAGWSSQNPSSTARRRGSASSPGVSPRDDFSPIAAGHDGSNAQMTSDEKLAIHNTITQNSQGALLHSAVSIGPMDVAALSPTSPTSTQSARSRNDKNGSENRLNDSIVLLSPDQFQTEIVLIKLIGTGACGSVHEAIWRGSLCAVKILHPSKQISQSTIGTFRREVELMSTIGDHPGVLKILAACLSPPHMCIITELATNGSLHAVIHDRHLRPEYSTLLDLGIQIADAIAFCHTKNLVHRDLKTHNILLGENNSFQVADFGLAMDMDEKTMADCSGQSALMGTSAYMAPEQFSGTKVDDKCDAYAFGCILWECITGIVPWSECNNIMQIVMAVGVERKRPPLPKGVPPPLVVCICVDTPLRSQSPIRSLALRDISFARPSSENAGVTIAGCAPACARLPNGYGLSNARSGRDTHSSWRLRWSLAVSLPRIVLPRKKAFGLTQKAHCNPARPPRRVQPHRPSRHGTRCGRRSNTLPAGRHDGYYVTYQM